MKTKLVETSRDTRSYGVLDKPDIKLVYVANKKQSERTLGCHKCAQLEWRFKYD